MKYPAPHKRRIQQRTPRRSQNLLSLVGIPFSLSLFLPSDIFASDPSSDLMEMSTEDLMRVNVYTASRFKQQASEAPASVTIITVSEIQKYGYHTLANTNCDMHAKLRP